jgi:hypothetical protein
VLYTELFFLSLYPKVLLNWGSMNLFFFFFNDLGALFNKGFLFLYWGPQAMA